MALYVGGGQIIHAPRTGRPVVEESHVLLDHAELLRPPLSEPGRTSGPDHRLKAPPRWVVSGMATDTAVPPSAPGYVQPEVDVPALTALLDGKYAEVRNLVRTNLAEYASDPRGGRDARRSDDFRERVRDVVVEMASTGQTGMGFPEEYGGGGDIGASIAAFETLAFGDLSVLVKVGVQFGLFGGAILQLGTKAPPRRLPRRPDHRQADGLLRDDRDRPRLQRAGARHGGDVRRGDAGVRDHHARRRRAQGLHRQRRQARRGRGRLRAARGRRRSPRACTPSSSRSARAARCCDGVRIEDDGRKMGLNGVDNGRIWFDEVRVPRDALLNRFADVTPAGVYESAIENPNRRFFTMLGTLVQGRVCVGGAGINASKVALAIATKYAVRRRQFEAASDERGGAAPRLRHAPAAAASR